MKMKITAQLFYKPQIRMILTEAKLLNYITDWEEIKVSMFTSIFLVNGEKRFLIAIKSQLEKQ
jgi:hypothetical protein